MRRGLGAPCGERAGQIAAQRLLHRQMLDNRLRTRGRKRQQTGLRVLQREGCHQSAARHDPDLPPCFSIRRTPPITMPLSRALAMS